MSLHIAECAALGGIDPKGFPRNVSERLWNVSRQSRILRC